MRARTRGRRRPSPASHSIKELQCGGAKAKALKREGRLKAHPPLAFCRICLGVSSRRSTSEASRIVACCLVCRREQKTHHLSARRLWLQTEGLGAPQRHRPCTPQPPASPLSWHVNPCSPAAAPHPVLGYPRVSLLQLLLNGCLPAQPNTRQHGVEAT